MIEGRETDFRGTLLLLPLLRVYEDALILERSIELVGCKDIGPGGGRDGGDDGGGRTGACDGGRGGGACGVARFMALMAACAARFTGGAVVG